MVMSGRAMARGMTELSVVLPARTCSSSQDKMLRSSDLSCTKVEAHVIDHRLQEIKFKRENHDRLEAWQAIETIGTTGKRERKQGPKPLISLWWNTD